MPLPPHKGKSMKLFVIIAALLLSACATTKDYCTEIGMNWGGAKYNECRMVEILVNTKQPVINIRIIN